MTTMACAPYPVAAPIGNVSLSNGNIMRGVQLGVGNPVQNLAFMPQWPMNNSYVYDSQGQCPDDQTTAWCTTFRGGQYDASTSGQKAGGLLAAGGAKGDADYDSSGDLWLNDYFVLNDNTTESNFPLGVIRADIGQGYTPQMGFGLGVNSTILAALKNTGKIASRSWSMFWGLTGATPDQQTDGTFVFGGFDSAKVKAANYTKALAFNNPSCGTGMLVSITDIKMRYPNGTSPSLFDQSQSTAISACIEPDFPGLMTLPLEYYTTFEEICQCSNVGRSVGVNFWTMLFDPTKIIYQGDLVLEIDSALTITVPNSQLLGPEVTISTTGQLAANYSISNLLINSIQDVNSKDLPILGRQFLSTAMVMANLDANTFTLWQAAPTSEQALVAVNSQGNIASFCSPNTTSNTTSATGAAGSTSGAATSSPATSPTPMPAGISTGAIAGAAVGGALVLIGAVVGIFFLFRRRQKQVKQSQGPLAGPANGDPRQHYSETSQHPQPYQYQNAGYPHDHKPPTPPYYPVELPPTSPYKYPPSWGSRDARVAVMSWAK